MNTTTEAVDLSASATLWLWLRASLYLRPYLTISLLLPASWLSYFALEKIVTAVKDKTTALSGPANPSFLFGLHRHINEAEDPDVLFEDWASQYGPAFRIPGGFGSSQIVICDPRANAHFYSKETFCYVQTKVSRIFIENLFGRGLLWAEGESHRRQRKALSPAFSSAAVRELTPVFYDATYKLKGIWDSMLDAAPKSGEAVIDVQSWMNHVTLDAIGIAGFGHDFHALDGKENAVVDVFDSFASGDTGLFSRFVFLMGPVFPILQKLPTKENLIFKRLKATMKGIAEELLARNREGNEGGEKGISEDRSIIGLLVKASTTSSVMSPEEILAQNVLLLAGYETPSITFTWALIELCKKPDKQQKLRDELSQFSGTNPTFDQLSSGLLPYLDAVTQEVLRLHPPIHETTRVATEDDIIPFSAPITTASGAQTRSLVIGKGTVVTSPIRYMNSAEVFWGANAKEFEPERWLDAGGGAGHGIDKAKEIQGHRHILSFSDGPRTCLGKTFALAELKAILFVLISSYTFSFPDGPDTKIEKHPSILPRPKVAGEIGAKVPMRIRRVE